MNVPPEEIDGARVLEWAVPEGPFFFKMPSSGGGTGIPIVGLAICQYVKTGSIYRFSCSAGWETENDAPFDSVESARLGKSAQFDVGQVKWLRR